jgi:hypothetical protein
MGQKSRRNIELKSPPKKATISLTDTHGINYPVFSFRYLQKSSIEDCSNADFFRKFLFRLKQLSELGWQEIRASRRHSYGMEKIRRNCIKQKIEISILTPEVEYLFALRATGDNHVFLGVEQNGVFHIVFVETNFGDIYSHQ